ncbi:hypothetical protein [Tomitella gaofuii]|nr:hypothetical protein [Tomitella gaofuii]
MTDSTTNAAPAGELAERVLASAVATIDLLSIALGDSLGYYRLLVRRPLTSP